MRSKNIKFSINLLAHYNGKILDPNTPDVLLCNMVGYSALKTADTHEKKGTVGAPVLLLSHPLLKVDLSPLQLPLNVHQLHLPLLQPPLSALTHVVTMDN